MTTTPNPDAGYEDGEITVTDRNGDEVEVTKNAVAPTASSSRGQSDDCG